MENGYHNLEKEEKKRGNTEPEKKTLQAQPSEEKEW
jgi:hypothetical protein